MHTLVNDKQDIFLWDPLQTLLPFTEFLIVDVSMTAGRDGPGPTLIYGRGPS